MIVVDIGINSNSKREQSLGIKSFPVDSLRILLCLSSSHINPILPIISSHLDFGVSVIPIIATVGGQKERDKTTIQWCLMST